MSQQTNGMSRRALLQYGRTLGAGIAAGGLVFGKMSVNPAAKAAQSTEAADPTATREAELKELDNLRTQVAEKPACTPAPDVTPTEVPAAPTGTPLPYRDIWTITVHGIAPLPGSDAAKPSGQFMQVNLAVSHSSTKSEIFPFGDFVLLDDSGRMAVIDQSINRQIFGNAWLLGVKPGATEERSLVFDIPTDAGGNFVLESQADPSFRVAMTVEQRG
jgi:hypothetical protein